MTTHGTLDDELDGKVVPLASHIILSVNMIERGSPSYIQQQIFETKDMVNEISFERF